MNPHFHFFDKQNKDKLNIEVRLSDLSIIHSGKRKGIKDADLLTTKVLNQAGNECLNG